MLKNIKRDLLVATIKISYSYPDEGAEKYADKIINTIDEELEPIVNAWMMGEELPLIKIGKYTIKTVMGIQKTNDFLYALELLNSYKLDPEAGEKAIWRPSNRLHF